ncbi:hypothetical protein EG329_008721 [Mollisiaceae sp. DMI_Dod_QoI]|nr:hypothetical protein EG329_008721 [Helotiales sp. DMI_Dod_QoI]
MDHNGFYSFDQNTIPHASMSPFESQQNDAAAFAQVQGGSFTAEQTPANDFSNADAAMNSTEGNFYSFNDDSFPQPAGNHLWNQNSMSNTYEEMLQGQYAFNESALPQPSVTNAFNLIDQSSTVDDNYPNWDASTFIGQQAFQDTLTDFSAQDWQLPGLGQNALSGVTTGVWQPSLLTGSALNAPFEVDESE